MRGVLAGLCGALALMLAACGSSDDSSAPTPSSAPAPETTTTTTTAADSGGGGASSLSAADRQAITHAFETFFAGGSEAETKMSVLQDPDRFADTIRAQSGSGLAAATTASVSDMDLVAPGRASVTYTISMNDEPVLPDQPGYAVEQDGQWKVSASSFCQLLTLENEGTPPAECAGQPGPADSTGTPAGTASSDEPAGSAPPAG